MAGNDNPNSGAVYLTKDDYKVIYAGKVQFRGKTIYGIVTKHTDRGGTERVTFWSQGGLMFRNNYKKEGTKDPDVRGKTMTFAGEENCEVAGWFFDAKENSSAGVSLKITLPENRRDRQPNNGGGGSGNADHDSAWGGSSGGGQKQESKQGQDESVESDEIPF